ncbi:hypothetical protein DFS34DRAFT_596680 [Phlyctochytrium arcticum]|nr:hypothetical protein DFS34DRAFT_596680 [Phlyctochytrium arcticum]
MRLDTALTRSNSTVTRHKVSDQSPPLVRVLAETVSEERLENVLGCQVATIQAVQEATSRLNIHNQISMNKFIECEKQLEQHIKVLNELRADLEAVFRKVRPLRARVGNLYPAEFAQVDKSRRQEDEDSDD